jgi:hypothetical protein
LINGQKEGNFDPLRGDENLRDGEGIYENKTPLIGYVLGSNSTQLKIHSLRGEKTLHILRFGSPIIKFLTN